MQEKEKKKKLLLLLLVVVEGNFFLCDMDGVTWPDKPTKSVRIIPIKCYVSHRPTDPMFGSCISEFFIPLNTS